MPSQRSRFRERIFSAILAPFRALSSLGRWIEWALDKTLTVPFRALTEFSIWIGWAFHRILGVPLRKLSRISDWFRRLWEPSLHMSLSFLAELCGWIGWAMLQILLAPSHVLSGFSHWLQSVWDPDPQEGNGFELLWQTFIMLPFNVVKLAGDLIWRIFSYPFRRWMDE